MWSQMETSKTLCRRCAWNNKKKVWSDLTRANSTYSTSPVREAVSGSGSKVKNTKTQRGLKPAGKNSRSYYIFWQSIIWCFHDMHLKNSLTTLTCKPWPFQSALASYVHIHPFKLELTFCSSHCSTSLHFCSFHLHRFPLSENNQLWRINDWNYPLAFQQRPLKWVMKSCRMQICRTSSCTTLGFKQQMSVRILMASINRRECQSTNVRRDSGRKYPSVKALVRYIRSWMSAALQAVALRIC